MSIAKLSWWAAKVIWKDMNKINNFRVGHFSLWDDYIYSESQIYLSKFVTGLATLIHENAVEDYSELQLLDPSEDNSESWMNPESSLGRTFLFYGHICLVANVTMEPFHATYKVCKAKPRIYLSAPSYFSCNIVVLFVLEGSVPVVYTDGSCFNNGQANPQAGVGVWWGVNDSR